MNDTRLLKAIASGLRNPHGAELTPERLEALAAWLEGLAERIDAASSISDNPQTQKYLNECQSVLLAGMPKEGMHLTKSAMAFKIRAAFSAGITCAEVINGNQKHEKFRLN